MKQIKLCTLFLFLLFLSVIATGFIKKTQHRFLDKSFLTTLLSRRYSGYDYDPSLHVSQEKILAVLKAGRLAPSAYNEQPWHFIVCDKKKHPEEYAKALSALPLTNRLWSQNAQVLLVIIVDPILSFRSTTNPWAEFDTGAALAYMALQATAEGLMSHMMGGIDQELLRESFDIPNNLYPLAMMAIGYASKDEAPPIKDRKPFHENFFEGNWNHPFDKMD